MRIHKMLMQLMVALLMVVLLMMSYEVWQFQLMVSCAREQLNT